MSYRVPQWVDMTPAMAREVLQANTNNRAFRPKHYANLTKEILRDGWRRTHQGIAFDENGVLMDGQHRLTFIASQPDDMVFPILVTHGLDRAEAYEVIDVKQAGRSTSDVLDVSLPLGRVANFIATLVNSCEATPALAKPYAVFAEPYMDALMAAASRNVGLWSSSASRCAAIYSMASGGDQDYVIDTYRSLVLQDYASMPLVAQVANRQKGDGKIVLRNGYLARSFVAKMLKVYDSRNANLKSLVLRDYDAAIDEVRKKFSRWVQIHDHAKEAPSRREVISDTSTHPFKER